MREPSNGFDANTGHPEVSVIIPTFNRGHVVDRAIRSALKQTYPVLEVLVVDDGSTDNTREVVEGFTDPRVRFVKLARNSGLAVARNAGIQRAAGELIGLLDSDDEWLPEKLSCQVRKMEESPPSVGLIYCGYETVGSGRPTFVTPSHRGDLHQLLLRRNVILGGGSCALIRRACFDAVGLFDETMRQSEDYDLWIRISRRYSIDFVPRVLARITKSEPNRLTFDTAGREQAARILRAKYGAALPPREARRVHAKRMLSIGVFCFGRNERRGARKFIWAAIQACPTSALAWFWLVIVLVPHCFYCAARAIRRLVCPR